jgi:hypothetical protein
MRSPEDQLPAPTGIFGDRHPGPVTTRLKQLCWGRRAEGWLGARFDCRD